VNLFILIKNSSPWIISFQTKQEELIKILHLLNKEFLKLCVYDMTYLCIPKELILFDTSHTAKSLNICSAGLELLSVLCVSKCQEPHASEVECTGIRAIIVVAPAFEERIARVREVRVVTD